MFALWPFGGGVRLEAHKEASGQAPPKPARLPKELIYPLLSRNGQSLSPTVAPGERVLRGQLVAVGEGVMHPPSHAATSGRVRGVEQRCLPHPSGLSGDCLVIDVDGEDASVAFDGVADPAALTPEALLARIHAAGIVGLGGAGFPAAVKANPGRPVDTLILNGAECEPYISCDDSLLRHFPGAVLAGAEILLRLLGAGRCLLGIEEGRPQALAALEQAKARGGHRAVEIVTVPAVYPAGGERQLIKTLTGREVPSGGIPADIGAVCHNVATAAAIHRALVSGEPLTSRIVTVTGQGVREPQNLLARIGTPMADLIEQCGGYTESAQRLIVGGPMMGFALPSDAAPVSKAVNCVFVAGRGEVAEARPAMACIRCGACAAVCPAGLLPQQLYWHVRAGPSEKALDYHLPDCIECGCCDVVCPSQIPLAQHFRAAKGRFAAQALERAQADHARLRHEARQARKEQEKAEAARRKKELLDKIKRG